MKLTKGSSARLLPRFACTYCDCTTFTIFVDGGIHCTSCVKRLAVIRPRNESPLNLDEYKIAQDAPLSKNIDDEWNFLGKCFKGSRNS